MITIPTVTTNSDSTLLDFDKGQQEITNEIIHIGNTLKSTISIKVTNDESGNIVKMRIIHLGER